MLKNGLEQQIIMKKKKTIIICRKKNKKVFGLMKNQKVGKIIKKFAAAVPNSYSYYVQNFSGQETKDPVQIIKIS